MSDPKLGIYRLICRLREVFVMSKKGGKAYYAVGVGRETGIFNSWNECKSQVEGVQNPKYKKFYNLDEAKEFVNSWKGKNQSYKEHIGNGSNPDSSNQTSVDQLKGDKNLYRNKFFSRKRQQNKLMRSNSEIIKNFKSHKFRRHSTGNVYSRQNKFQSVPPEGDIYNNMLKNIPQRYFHMTYPDDPVDDQSRPDVDVSVSNGDAGVVRMKRDRETVIIASDSDCEVNLTKECTDGGSNISVGSTSNGHTDVESKSFCELKTDPEPKEVCSRSKVGSDNGGAKRSETDQLDDERVTEICRRILKEHMTSLEISDVNKKLYMKSVTSSLEKIVNVVTSSLNQITSRVLSCVNSNAELETYENTRMTVSQESTVSNTFSGGMGQLNESSNQNQTLLQEKFDNCERKIDMCFGQVSSIVAGLTQARDEIRELRKMCLMKGNILMEGRNQSAKPVTNAKYLSTYNGSISGSPSHTKKKFSDEKMVDSEKDDLDVYQPPAKRKKDGDESSDTTCNTFDYDGAIKREKADYIGFTIDEDDYVIVYTDGACTSNGMGNAKAGIGIWFGDGHPMNVGRPFKGVPPTNNNAEIQAARIAIELALSAGIKKLRILTDSEFVINCATKWVQQWKEKGWITGSKSPVKNRVELEKLDRVMSKLSVRWEKVCAHSGVFGNEMADRLANNGAESYERQ